MADSKPVRVLIFGHSFVCHLNKYLVQKSKGVSSPTPWSNFKFASDDIKVGFLGVRGGTISSKRGSPLRKKLFHVSNARPDIVFLEIGTNDLSDTNVSPQSLVSDILKFANYFLHGCGVKVVVLGAVLLRKCLPAGVPDFNSRVTETNVLLKQAAVQEQRIMFAYHVGFEKPVNEVYFRDGIHLNNESGYRKYTQSVRGAILRARKLVQSLCL